MFRIIKPKTVLESLNVITNVVSLYKVSLTLIRLMSCDPGKAN